MDSRTIIKKLTADGWYLVGIRGDHHQFRHPVKKGRVTVQHPKKDLDISIVKYIEKQSGLKLR